MLSILKIPVLNVISVTELFFNTKSVQVITRYFEAFLFSIIYFMMTYGNQVALYRKRKWAENYNLVGNQMQVATPEDMLREQTRTGTIRRGGNNGKGNRSQTLE